MVGGGNGNNVAGTFNLSKKAMHMGTGEPQRDIAVNMGGGGGGEGGKIGGGFKSIEK